VYYALAPLGLLRDKSANGRLCDILRTCGGSHCDSAIVHTLRLFTLGIWLYVSTTISQVLCAEKNSKTIIQQNAANRQTFNGDRPVYLEVCNVIKVPQQKHTVCGYIVRIVTSTSNVNSFIHYYRVFAVKSILSQQQVYYMSSASLQARLQFMDTSLKYLN
jgi:hypothetical protein